MADFDTGLGRNTANYAALTPIDFIARAAAVYGKRTAIIHGALRQDWDQTYRRTRRLPGWPYNLFAMIHARDAQASRDTLARIDEQVGLGSLPGAVLVGTRCYKQRNTRYAPQQEPS